MLRFGAGVHLGAAEDVTRRCGSHPAPLTRHPLVHHTRIGCVIGPHDQAQEQLCFLAGDAGQYLTDVGTTSAPRKKTASGGSGRLRLGRVKYIPRRLREDAVRRVSTPERLSCVDHFRLV
jgi:hypothetical protein